MKHLLIVCLLFPFVIKAQDTCGLKQKKDPYTREIKIYSGSIELTGAKISVQASKTEVDIMLTVTTGEKCFDDNIYAYVFFEGTKLRTIYRNSGATNCDGIMHFTFRNVATTPSALEKLSKQKVVSIKIQLGEKKEQVIEFTPEQQDAFMKAVACIIPASKTIQ